MYGVGGVNGSAGGESAILWIPLSAVGEQSATTL